jgi:hypothetical protein
MGGTDHGLAGLSAAPPPGWNRFAGWPRWPARIVLAAVLVLLVLAAFSGRQAPPQKVKTQGWVENIAGKDGPQRARDDDLALYDRAIARIGKGENYYDFILSEHRAAQYPVRPGLAVRLPTLAYLNVWLGSAGLIVAAVALLAGVMLSWWRRLDSEPGDPRLKRMALAFLFLGASLGLNRYYFQLHELWAGMLIALSFGLHRVSAGAERFQPSPPAQPPIGYDDRVVGPGERAGAASGIQVHLNSEPNTQTNKWIGAWLAAALALSIRELVLPYVLLMAAYALWRRAWKEAAAWALLIAVFLGLLAWHLSIVSTQVLPSDPPSPSWFALRGLWGWTSNVALASNLRFFPHWIAAPLVLLAVLGWAGWKSPAGSFGALLFLGYGVMFMIAGRNDNFYWGALIGPALMIGFAYVPMAIKGLWQASMSSPASHASGPH